MKKQDYDKAMQELQAEFENKKKLLIREYALSNNTYKVGDIFQDHIGRIRVEAIKFTTGFGEKYPSCVYFGIELNKDGSDNKKGKKREAWQGNKEKV